MLPAIKYGHQIAKGQITDFFACRVSWLTNQRELSESKFPELLSISNCIDNRIFEGVGVHPCIVSIPENSFTEPGSHRFIFVFIGEIRSFVNWRERAWEEANLIQAK